MIDFRHLNIKIASNNLVYPLLKDTFSVLGCSRCAVLSVLDMKDAFHSLRLSENSKRCSGIFVNIFVTSFGKIPVTLFYVCKASTSFIRHHS